MKRFAALFALLLFSSMTRAQDATSVSVKPDVSVANTEDARMKALEEQVRALAGEIALLRSELKELRETKAPEQSSAPQVLLASAHPEPGMLPSAPAAPQVAQTQTFADFRRCVRQCKTPQSGHQLDRRFHWHRGTQHRFSVSFTRAA